MRWFSWKGLGWTVGAWFGAQVLAGIEAGLVAAGLALTTGMPVAAAIPIATVAGLPLLAVQFWLLVRLRSYLTGADARELRIGLGVLAGYAVTAPFALIGGTALTGTLLATAVSRGLLVLPAGKIGPADLPPWVIALAGTVVFGALTVLAAAWQLVAGRLRGERLRDALVGGFALHGIRPIHLLLGALVGASVGWMPAVISDLLAARLATAGGGALGWLDAALTHGSPSDRFAMALMVVVIGPVAEEFVFRGFAWDAMRRWVRPAVVVVVTSFLFAAAHLDPVHATSVFFIGLVLGGLRAATGSIVPSLVAHVVNNGLGVLLASAGVGVPWPVALGLAVVSVLAAATAAVHRDPIAAASLPLV